MSKEQLRI